MKWPGWLRRSKSTAVEQPRAQFRYDRFDVWPQQWPNTSTLVDLTEDDALGLSGIYRAVMVVAGTLATLPIVTLQETGPGRAKPVKSIFDDPDGPGGQTPYEWKETGFTHLMLHGKAAALKVRNVGGGLVRLPWVHPLSFRERWPDHEDYASGRLPAGGLWFDVQLANGRSVTLDADDVFYVPGPSLDGRTGVGLLQRARESLNTAQAGDRAAGQMFENGSLISGALSPEGEMEPEDLPLLRSEVDKATRGGWRNAGGIALFNKLLKFTPWTMTSVDAQFLQQRQFSIEEISRWTGVPPHLLMQTEKQTSWGTGVEMQDRALGRSVLNPWSTRFEQRATRLLPAPRRVEFDFATIERPAPETEQAMTLELHAAGVITLEETRTRLRLGPAPAELTTEPDPEQPAIEGGRQEGGDDDPDAA